MMVGPLHALERVALRRRALRRCSETGSAHIDMLWNMFLIITIFYVIASTIQITLADVSARNSNRLALQTFQVVYDRRALPQALQGGAAQSETTRGQDPNIQYAVSEARSAATLTGGTVFASGILGGQAGLQGLGEYRYQGAYFNRGAYAGCSASQQVAQPRFEAGNNLRTTVRSEYPWRFGPIALCLTNTGEIVGRSN
jgi:hypothetical protein